MFNRNFCQGCWHHLKLTAWAEFRTLTELTRLSTLGSDPRHSSPLLRPTRGVQSGTVDRPSGCHAGLSQVQNQPWEGAQSQTNLTSRALFVCSSPSHDVTAHCSGPKIGAQILYLVVYLLVIKKTQKLEANWHWFKLKKFHKINSEVRILVTVNGVEALVFDILWLKTLQQVQNFANQVSCGFDKSRKRLLRAAYKKRWERTKNTGSYNRKTVQKQFKWYVLVEEILTMNNLTQERANYGPGAIVDL